jgi:hypothetical protein
VLTLLRNKIFLIAVVCLAPIVVGWAIYLSGWTPGARGNYGELLAPRPLPAAALAPARGKWALVTFDAAACDPYCEKKLYYMRQIRRAQGKGLERIERVWVLADEARAPRPELERAIEGTRLARDPEGRLAAEFPHAGRVSDHIYLVDPLGNLMMRYPRDPDPSKMIKDLKRLLKYSRIG